MKYQIIVANSAEEMEEFVNRHIGTDWIPQGGVSVFFYQNSNTTRYNQAMIKVTKKEKE